MLKSIVRTRILGVIPARFASSRFPGKALATIAGKPMLQHVYERASQARYLSKLIIATDDERIHKAARAFGAQVMMTRADHLSGTDRVAEAASADNAAWSSQTRKARRAQHSQRRSLAEDSRPRAGSAAKVDVAGASPGDRLRIDDADPTRLAVFARQIR